MKKFLVTLLIMCMVATLIACNDSSENKNAEAVGTQSTLGQDSSEATEVTDADGAEHFFGISLPLTNSEYYKGVQDNLTAICDEYGIKFSVASADEDISKQVSQMENFITMGVDTIIVYPIDKEGLSDAMKKARKAGIRVLSATMAPEDLEAYDISVDADQGVVGDAGAKFLADWVEENYPDAEDGSIEVCVFGVWLDENTGKRCDAFANVEQYSSKVKIVDTYEIGMTDAIGDTQKYAELMMQKHPEVKGVISYTDTLGLIVNEVMMSTSGLDASQVCNVTIDKTTAVMEQIQLAETNESTIRATVASGEDFNRTLVDAALGQFNKHLDAEKKYYIDAYVIDAGNVEEAMQ